MEDKWFPNTTWEGEAVTKVFFRAADSKTAQLVKKMVDQYLQSLFFKDLDPKVKGYQVSVEPRVWLVDMSRKEYKMITNWEATRLSDSEGIPFAKPSQLPLFMKEFRGTLTGAKFGI